MKIRLANQYRSSLLVLFDDDSRLVWHIRKCRTASSCGHSCYIEIVLYCEWYPDEWELSGLTLQLASPAQCFASWNSTYPDMVVAVFNALIDAFYNLRGPQ